MSSVNTDYSKYLHTYEAFRIPKGHEALNAPNANLVKTEDGGSGLILTPESSRQLIEDRFAYNGMKMAEAQMAAQESQAEGERQLTVNQSKIYAVVRSMSRGDRVPASDERKVMEYDDKLYQHAKMAQMMAQYVERQKKNKESEWDDKEEEENRKRLEELGKEATELAQNLGIESQKFAEAQEAMVVEVDASNVDLSSIQGFFQFTSSIGGAFFDTSI